MCLLLLMAKHADRMTPALAGTVSHQAAPVEVAAAPATGRTLNIAHDARGHFATEGRINGQRIGFMVDTGASVIALEALAPEDPAEMNKTVVHEVGHMMNQAGESAIAGLDVATDHGETYIERGHQGGHCGHGIDAAGFGGGGDLDGRDDAGGVM